MKLAGGHSGRRAMRFTPLNRMPHVLLIISFLSLAATGMVLKFAYTEWALYEVKLMGGVESAEFLHRFAALLLFGVFFTHFYDLFRKKKSEYKSWKDKLFSQDSLLPNKKDWQDVIGTMKWFFNKGPRPNYGR